MNKENDELVDKHCGLGSKKELHGLQRWLNCKDFAGSPNKNALPYSLRIAQSPVVRSELEMFGLSTPRFALRAIYEFSPEHISLIGLRRLEFIKAQLPDIVRTSDEDIPSGCNNATPMMLEEVINISSSIVDCVLDRPCFLKEDKLDLLQAELGLVYGESKSMRGTPYMKHIKLGGGTCAQAACFICSMLMIDYTCSVDGPIEISVKAEDLRTDKGPDLLPINGLQVEQICRYFNRTKSDEEKRLKWDHTREKLSSTSYNMQLEQMPPTTLSGLRAHKEYVAMPAIKGQGVLEANKVMQAARSDLWCRTVDAYVASGIPVIVPVDSGRMMKPLCTGTDDNDSNLKAIYGKHAEIDITEFNGGNEPFKYKEMHQGHAVVVVGRHVDNGILSEDQKKAGKRPKYTFVINDPGVLPFFPVKGEALYLSSWGNKALFENNDAEDELNFHRDLIAVTPDRVKMPLLDSDLSAEVRDKNRPSLVMNKNITVTHEGIETFNNANKDLDTFIALKDHNEGLRRVYRLIEVTRRFNPEKTSKVLTELRDFHGIQPEIYQTLRKRLRWSGIWTRWVWLDILYDPESTTPAKRGRWQEITVWDAEQEPPAHIAYNHDSSEKTLLPNSNTPSDYLFHTFASDSENPDGQPGKLVWSNEEAGHDRRKRRSRVSLATKNPKQVKGLTPNILSSFSTDGLRKSLKLWAEGVESTDTHPAVELYAFMQTHHDLRLLNPNYKRSRRRKNIPPAIEELKLDQPVTHWLKVLDNHDKYSIQVAKNICEMLDERSDLYNYTRPKIAAIASYIPEISYTYSSTQHKRARKALKALTNLAINLKKDSDDKPGEPIKVIEAVAGSRVVGAPVYDTHQFDRPPYNNYKIDTQSQEAALLRHYYCCSPTIEEMLDNVCAGLRPACDLIEQSGITDLKIAMELEPGPAFILNSFEAMERFAAKLEEPKNKIISKHVGFNLDIGHWMLAGITPVQVLTPQKTRFLRGDLPNPVFKRIIHAHFSGVSSRGHIADTHPLDLNVREDYLPWIDLLKRRIAYGQQRAALPYSFGVSLEMECAKSMQQVSSALGTLNGLIDSKPIVSLDRQEVIA